MDDQTGRTLQGYEIFDRIGSGGFGVVYRAYQSTLGREVALKLILPGHANRPEFIRRFQAEAQLIARLEHLHIVPLYDFWRDPGGAYLVTRFLKGGNLKQALEEGPFDLKAASLFLEQVASGLSYAHGNGVVHRDVKPANILLDEEGNCYLTDFGIAVDSRNLERSQAGEDIPSRYLEALYPEQARNEPVSPQSDIYSLGVVLYEVLTGTTPFPNTSQVERLFKHLNDPLPEIDDLIDPEIREGVNAVIQKATAKNPKHRYQDVLEMASAFRAAAKLGDGQAVNVFEVLTLREQGILEHIVAGRTNREISQELFVELSTVKWYVRQIYSKLGVRSRKQAVVRARESGLFSRGGRPVSLAETQSESTSTSLVAPGNPYKGLRPFEVADARDFYGREVLVQKLLDRLAQTWQRGAPPGNGRFLAVVGPSGSGKSSLIKAGLIPALMAGGVRGSERWFIAQMEPGSRPLDELEVALVRLAAERAGDLREQLERDPFGLVRAAGLILPHDGSELVLVVDQFEELFTLVQEESERAHSLDLLSAAALEPNSRVRVVITLRADFYDRPLVYPVFGELVRNCLETVLPLSAEELERAILGPVEQAGVAFEPGVVARIIEDVFYQPGALPMLQYALTELFEHREGHLLTQAAYQKIGGASGALSQRAEELYLEMDAPGRKAIQQIFLRLVNFSDEGGTKQSFFTRRRALRAELLGLADEDLIVEILDTFSRYRLFSLDHEPTTRRPTVELAHEALLSKWERLQRLLDESQEDLYTQRRLSVLVAEWEQSGRDSGYLLRSSRLDQYAGWSAHTKLALTAAERSLLEISLVERQARQEEEAARQEREIESARQLAETEARRAQEQIRTSRRLRWLASGLAVFLTLAIGAAWFAMGQQRLARTNETIAEQNAAIAEQNAATAVAARGEAEQLAALRLREAQVNQSLALAAQSRLALQADNLDLALALAWEAVQIPDPPGQAQLALSEAAYAPGTIRVFTGHQAEVLSVAVSPDGVYGLSGDEDGVIFLWNLETGEALRQLEGHSGSVTDLAFTPDGRKAVSASQDSSLIYWDLETAEILGRLEGHQDRVNAVAISPDGRLAASVSGRKDNNEAVNEDNSLRLWDLLSGEEVRRFDFFADGVTGVDFSPDGRRLAVATISEGFSLLDVNTEKVLFRSGVYLPNMSAVEISEDGRLALVSSLGPFTIFVWNLHTGEFVGELSRYNGPVDGLAISPDGQRALGGSQWLIEWDLGNEEEIQRFSWGTNAIAYLPGGETALIASWDHTVRLLGLGSGAEKDRLSEGMFGIMGLAYSPEGHIALIATLLSLFSWDLETNKNIWSEPTFFDEVAFSLDGKRFLVSQGNLATLRDTETGKTLLRLESDGSFEGQDRLDAVAFHPSGKYALTGSQFGPHLIYWNLENGKPVWLFETGQVLGVAISPDGRTALSADDDGAVNWWDLETGQLLKRLEGHTNLAWGVSFIDNRTAISTSDDRTMILWDLESGTPLRTYLGHTDGIKRVALSPDKRLAISASRDGTAILWDVQTGEPLRRYSGHKDQLRTVAFHPNGAEAVTGGHDSQVIRWRIDADLKSFLEWVEGNRYVRGLTCAEREVYNTDPLCTAEKLAAERASAEESEVVAPAPLTGKALLPPLPLPTPATPEPTIPPAAPKEAGLAVRGENFGSIPVGGGQVWEYAGTAGETLSILATAPRPVEPVWSIDYRRELGLLDTTLAVYNPDGSPLAQADDLENGVVTDAYLAALTLPESGIYRIEVRSFRDESGGDYRLILGDPRPLVFDPGLPVTAGLAIHPDGQTVLIGVGNNIYSDSTPSADNRIRVWDIERGEVVHYLEGHANTSLAISIRPDGRRALSADLDGVAILWDLENWTEIRRFDNAGQPISGIQFHPDGETFLTSSYDATLARWDLESGEVLQRFEGHSGTVFDLAISPDGMTLYSASEDKTVRTWDLRTGESLATYRPLDEYDRMRPIALSPDGSRLLVGGGNFGIDYLQEMGINYGPEQARIALLDARTGEKLGELVGHSTLLYSIAFSPDGRYALTCGEDQTVRLWEVDTGEQLAVFTGHASWVWEVAFSPDGLTGYSTGLDGSLRVWDLRDFIGARE